MQVINNNSGNSLHEIFSSGRPQLQTDLVKSYSTKELSQIYGVSPRTFSRWIEPFKENIKPRNGRFYSVLQVEQIFCCLGMPYRINKWD